MDGSRSPVSDRFFTVLAIALLIAIPFALPQSYLNEALPRTATGTERSILELLILLPLATVVVAFVRIFIGIEVYGTYTPALLALAFREGDSFVGLLLLPIFLMIGWGLLRALDPLNLLSVPRLGFLMSALSMLFLACAAALRRYGIDIASTFGMMPLVIVGGVVERIYLRVEEQGGRESLAVLVNTLVTAWGVWFLVRWQPITAWLCERPERLTLCLAAHLALGCYGGYRVTELLRFSRRERTAP